MRSLAAIVEIQARDGAAHRARIGKGQGDSGVGMLQRTGQMALRLRLAGEIL